MEGFQMSGWFLDVQRPLTTCSAGSCDGCPVSRAVHCHFQSNDLAAFLLNVAPCFAIGVAGIARVGGWWLLPWLAMLLGYFGFVEIRVMCSHCPHYAEPGKSLQCWANYGSPRLWKYRPGPMSSTERLIFEGGMLLILAYPLAFLVFYSQWLLLALLLLTGAAGFVTLKRSFCSQCMNFACPLNTVDEEIRNLFFKRNPLIAAAWGIGNDEPAV
jgi:hypothetical protein